MKISGSRVRAFLVILWTVLSAVMVLGYVLLTYEMRGQGDTLAIGLEWLGIPGSILIGLWGLTAVALLHRTPRLGAVTLLAYSAFGALTYTSGLVDNLTSVLERLPLERLPQIYRSTNGVLYLVAERIDVEGYVIQVGVVIAFLLTAIWCANRLFPSFADTQRRTGTSIAVVALLVAISPYVGKVYLLSTVPPIEPWPLSHHGSNTSEFLKRLIDEAFKKTLVDGERLAKHCTQSKAALVEYQRSITTLEELHAKMEQSVRATEREECGYLYIWTQVENRVAAIQKARKIQTRVMIGLTLIAAAFLFFVLRSKQVLGWTRGFSMIAMGAVLAGWFPL